MYFLNIKKISFNNQSYYFFYNKILHFKELILKIYYKNSLTELIKINYNYIKYILLNADEDFKKNITFILINPNFYK